MAESFFTDEDDVAGRHLPDQAPELSTGMEALAIQNEAGRDAVLVPPILQQCPDELTIKWINYLSPDATTAQISYANSDEFRLVEKRRQGLQGLCGATRALQSIAMPLLYRTVVVSDPHKLCLLRRTLEDSPNYGYEVKSLSVYRDFDQSDVESQNELDRGGDPGTITLSEFSEALVAVLMRTPELRILTLSLNKLPNFQDDEAFSRLGNCLVEDMNRNQTLLPGVETLAILLTPGARSEIQRDREYTVFKGLLNFSALRNIIVRRPPIFTPGIDVWSELLRQRNLPLRCTIESLDLRSGRRICWDDIRTLTSMFSTISSLALWHHGHNPAPQELPPDWPGPEVMENLRHLSIDITSPEVWTHCPWFWESIRFRFRIAPNLETLRIPLRLLRTPRGVNLREGEALEVPGWEIGPLLDPSHVLPYTLESLVLIADLRVFEIWDPEREGSAPMPEYEGQQNWLPLSRHLTFDWTLRFLWNIMANSQHYHPHLNTLALEYETNILEGSHNVSHNQISGRKDQDFAEKLQLLGEEMERNGIHFSWTGRQG